METPPPPSSWETPSPTSSYAPDAENWLKVSILSSFNLREVYELMPCADFIFMDNEFLFFINSFTSFPNEGKSN